MEICTIEYMLFHVSNVIESIINSINNYIRSFARSTTHFFYPQNIRASPGKLQLQCSCVYVCECRLRIFGSTPHADSIHRKNDCRARSTVHTVLMMLHCHIKHHIKPTTSTDLTQYTLYMRIRVLCAWRTFVGRRLCFPPDDCAPSRIYSIYIREYMWIMS